MGEGVKPKLTVEEYVRFVEQPGTQGFSLHQLNQIVLMHGFLKLKTKKAIVKSLGGVDLMFPTRSTLKNQEAYPCAPLALDEVRADIGLIGWQECPIGSVSAETVRSTGAARDEAATTAFISETDLICAATSSRSAAGKKKRKCRTAAASISATDLICPATTNCAVAGKRKRKRRTDVASISASDLICPATTSNAVPVKRKRKRRTTAAVPLQLAPMDA